MLILTRPVAMQAYRAAWHNWLLCGDKRRRWHLERLMNSLLEGIRSGPTDPAWLRFLETLPCYLEVYKRLQAKVTQAGKPPT